MLIASTMCLKATLWHCFSNPCPKYLRYGLSLPWPSNNASNWGSLRCSYTPFSRNTQIIRITPYLSNVLHFLALGLGAKSSISMSHWNMFSHSSSIDERSFGVTNTLIRATYVRTSRFTSSLLTVLFGSSTKSLPSRAAAISSSTSKSSGRTCLSFFNLSGLWGRSSRNRILFHYVDFLHSLRPTGPSLCSHLGFILSALQHHFHLGTDTYKKSCTDYNQINLIVVHTAYSSSLNAISAVSGQWNTLEITCGNSQS